MSALQQTLDRAPPRPPGPPAPPAPLLVAPPKRPKRRKLSHTRAYDLLAPVST